MAETQDQCRWVGQFRSSLTKVVELGYGDDACDAAVTVLFEDLVRQVVPSKDMRRLPFKLPSAESPDRNTHTLLLERTAELERFVDRIQSAGAIKRRPPVVFPFLTTLALFGGLFVLVAQTARLARYYL